MTYAADMRGEYVTVQYVTGRVRCFWPECQYWIDPGWIGAETGDRDQIGGLRTEDGWCCPKHVRLVQTIGGMMGWLK
jgi:hypothetical protein